MTAKESSKSSGINQEVGTPASLINSKNHGREVRVLPADVYDTLELSALAYGGIGRVGFYTETNPAIPLCAYGHGALASDLATETDPRYAMYSLYKTNPIAMALAETGIFYSENDEAVEAINLRKGKPISRRVTWGEYCAELNIVRGD